MTTSNKNKILYQWKGIDKAGEKRKGYIEASGSLLARIELGKRGIIAKTIGKASTNWWDKKNRKITAMNLSDFTRQLLSLLEAGVPLLQALDLIIVTQKKERMTYLLISIKQDIEKGLSFAEALRNHPHLFNVLFCNLIEAGEKSGSLVLILEKIAIYQEKMTLIKRKITKIAAYPLIVFVIALLVTAGLLTLVIPQFESIFRSFGGELPLLTRKVIILSQFFQSYWTMILAGITVFLSSTLHFKKYSFIQYFLHKLILKIPYLGVFFRKAIIARFTQSLRITLAAGLPLLEALKTIAGTTGNLIYTEAIHQMEETIISGESIHRAMTFSGLFPNQMIQMIAIAEETGKLETTLQKISHNYDVEVDFAIELFSNLLEPLLIIILGLIMGFLIIALYLPIFNLGTTL